MMKKQARTLRFINTLLGFIVITALVFSLVVLLKLQPKMLAFNEITILEQNLLTVVGFGLLLLLVFDLLSTLQLVIYFKRVEKIKAFYLILLILGIISGLLVFSDVALLSDINRQYHNQLSQPEWQLVYPFIIYQFVITLIFQYCHLTGKFLVQQEEMITRDINIFLVVQVVGVVCGVLGLGLMSLGFLYSRAWTLTVHTIISMGVLLFPYALAVGYWIFMKLKEKDRQWYDEKQSQDVGKSAFLTLVIVTFIMVALFFLHYFRLDGVIRMLWLPFYIFSTLFLFSLGNLYFSNKT
jgi:hypothetical protein